MQRIANALAFGAMILLCALTDAAPQEPAASRPAPADYELKLVYVFGEPEIEFVFVIGNSGFKTVAALERFIVSLPAGSTLRWNPGCERLGREPLLSSEENMAKFVAFCREHRVNLVLVPSG